MDFSNLINIRQTPGFAKFFEFFHWQTINPRKNVNYYIRHIPYLGAIIKIEKINPKNINLAEIEEIARRKKALFVKIEPFADVSKQNELDKIFYPRGFVHDSWPLTSTATRIINLQQTIDNIIEQFKSKTRYNLRLAQKNELRVQMINGEELAKNTPLLKQFIELFNQRAREIRSETHSFQELLHTCRAHGENLEMLYTPTSNSQHLTSEMTAVALFLFTPDICHYWHNGSTKEGRTLFAPTFIIAEGIRLAKEKHCKIFDFEGIYDERFKSQTRRWKGFTRFKEGFGGEKVIFARPYIKYHSPIFKFFHFLRMI